MRGFVTLRLRRMPVSVQVGKRTVAVVLLLFAMTVAAAIASLGAGQLALSPMDVVRSLWGSGAEHHVFVVQTLRLPRILVGLMVGAALGLSGAILQGLFRNPLAAPDILGVTGGAAVAAVAFLVYGQGLSIWWLPAAAFTGAMGIALLLYLIAWKAGVSTFRLVLVGIGLKAATAALTTLLVVKSPIYLTQKAMVWLTGSIYGTAWIDVGLLAPWLAVLTFLVAVSARHVNALQLGDEVAAGVGAAVSRQRLFLLMLCAALCGAAVAVGGAIGFVALLAPHIARQLVGPSFGPLAAAAALTGSLMVVVADAVARTAFAPLDIPVGVFTAAVGAPFFLYLLVRHRNR